MLNHNILKHLKFIALFLFTTICFSCKVQYGFTQPTSIDAKTFQVNHFQNNAPLVEPGLDRDFRTALQDLIVNQTNLDLVTSGADLTYEGEITEYRISPTTATSENTAAQNRLTISVQVRFFDKNNPENDIDQRFSFFYDFDGSTQLDTVKATAFEEIFERLTQDIINATLAKW
ncbi:MAG: LptE family protein [Flavobacteriaceae bacterium]|nr:LptE family protein [Flavobacteriaceae bacterium]